MDGLDLNTIVTAIISTLSIVSTVAVSLTSTYSKRGSVVHAERLIKTYTERKKRLLDISSLKYSSDILFEQEQILSKQIISETAQTMSRACAPILSNDEQKLREVTASFFFLQHLLSFSLS